MDPRTSDDRVTPRDEHFLERTVSLGRRGWGWVHPNPMVGCVIVQGDEVVGEGWHEELGGAHAEVNALARAGERAQGATAYVSLEPCNHFGRTPPCSVSLVESGVTRVVYGAPEPGAVAGGGAETLRARGVEVVGPVFSMEEARRENPAFYYNQEHGATWVALKLAQTLDGKIAARPGERTAITGPEAQRETHRLRAGFDAILVGSGTAAVDDPLLTVRADVTFRVPPARMVLDTEARLSPRSRLLQTGEESPVMVFTALDAPLASIRDLEAVGAHVYPVPRGSRGLSLPAVLTMCWERGIRSVFCEGGARLAQTLVSETVAQRIFLFVAPFVLGGQGVAAFPEGMPRRIWDPWVPLPPPRLFGRDLLMTLERTV